MKFGKIIAVALMFSASLKATSYDWGSPQARSGETGFAAYTSCSINSLGNGVCAWGEIVDEDVVVRASYYDGSSWGDPVTISTGNQSVYHLHIEINDSNQAVLVWSEKKTAGGSFFLKSSFLDSGEWGTPSILYSGEVSAVTLAYNNSNEVFVGWTNESDEVDSRAFYNDEWQTVNNLGSGSLSPSGGDLNNDSTTFGIWLEDQGGSFVIQAVVMPLRGGLDIQDVSESSPLAQGAAAISGNASGNALAVWVQNSSLYYSQYITDSWTTPVVISTGEVSVTSPPQVTYTDSGIGFASWTQSADSITSVYAARFDGSSWETPSRVSAEDSSSIVPMQDATTATNAVINFVTQLDNRVLQSSSWDNGGWTDPVTISSTSRDVALIEDALAHDVSVNSSGEAISTWADTNGTNTVVRTSNVTVTEGSGVQKTVRFAMQSETANFLTWTAFSGDPAELRVYRDDTWIDTLLPQVTSYVDQLRVAGESFTYLIKALDDSGNIISTARIVVE